MLLIGAAHLDRRSRASGRFVLGASNPGVTTESVGGACYNAATALRAFGAAAALFSVRGGDDAGAVVTGAIADAGIADLSATWLDRRTPTYSALLDEAGGLVGAIADMELYDLLGPRSLRRRSTREAIRAAPAILIDANLPVEAIACLADLATGRPMAAIGVSPAKVGRLKPLLPSLTALFVTRLEAASLADLDAALPMDRLADALAALGVPRAVVTDGGRPAALLDGRSIHLQEPPALTEIRDVTGAGDTLAAIAFMALHEERPFQAAVRLGMAAAALRISTGLEPGCRTACETVAASLPPALQPSSRT